MNIGEMMKQAAAMQSKMKELQEEIGGMEAEGVSGGGLVRVTMTGKNYASRVAIDPSLMVESEREVLEDLITAAINDARAKIETKGQEAMKEITAGMTLPPGVKLPF